MQHRFKEKQEEKGAVTLYFGGDVESLANKVNEFFITRGYRVKSGIPGDAEYVTGNYALRLFLGAFVKYYKFSATVAKQSNGDVAVTIRKAHTGFSGGAIGMVKLNKELKKIGTAMENIGDNLGMYQPV